MKKLMALAAVVCSTAVLQAETPIPDGLAVYDITVSFSEFPELNAFGDWPLRYRIINASTFDVRGRRISASADKTSATYRLVLNLKQIMEKAQSTSATPKLIFLENCFGNQPDDGLDANERAFCGSTVNYDFTGVTTVEGFANVVKQAFVGKTSTWRYNEPAPSSVVVSFQDLSFALVEGDSIPSGMALYDVTLGFTEFPDLNAYGAWPVHLRLKLGPLYTLGTYEAFGQRIAVGEDKKSLKIRVAMDLQAMIDYSKTYNGADPWIDLRRHATQLSNSNNDDGSWNSSSCKYNFEGISSVQGFSEVILLPLIQKSTYVSTSRGGTGTKSMLLSLSFDLVRDLVPVAAGEKKYDVSVTFHNPLSAVGFKTVTSVKLCYPNLFDIELKNPVASGSVYTAPVKLDLAQMVATINGTYQSTGNAQAKVYASGIGADGNQITDQEIVTSGSMKVPKVASESTVADLENSLFNGVQATFGFQNFVAASSAEGCRFVGLTIDEHKSSGLTIIFR